MAGQMSKKWWKFRLHPSFNGFETYSFSFIYPTSLRIGLHYAFKPNQSKIARLLWLSVITVLTFLGFYLSAQNFIDWKNEPVLTTVATTGLNCTDILWADFFVRLDFLHSFYQMLFIIGGRKEAKTVCKMFVILTAGLSIANIPFPSVAICSEGISQNRYYRNLWWLWLLLQTRFWCYLKLRPCERP